MTAMDARGALRAAALALSLLIIRGSAPAATEVLLDDLLAEILELEDRRSTGDGRLQDLLRSPQPPAVRARAALALGRIGSPVATPYDLLGALGDESPEVRRMAVFALGEMDDVKGAPLLARAMGEPDAGVRALAVEALGKLKDPASLGALARGLGDPDPEVAGMTLLALWKLEAGDALPELVGRATGIYLGAGGELRRRAAYFLMRAQMGRAEEDSFEPPLRRAASDEDPLIRSYAARGLGARSSEAATRELLRLADDTDRRARINAFNGLRSRPVEGQAAGRAVWPLYEAALSGTDTGVALAALAALESCRAAEARERLAGALGDPRPRFREVAALALAARDEGAALGALLPLASDPVWSVRARIAEALAAAGPPDSDALRSLAADKDARVRAAAVAAMGTAEGGAPEARVTEALEDDDPFVRAAAVEAIGARARAGRDDVVASLAEASRRAAGDAQNDVRLAALAALGKIGTEEAGAAIERALDDADYLVRRRAAELLRDVHKRDRFGRVGEPKTGRAREDYFRAVQRARKRVTAHLETAAGRIRIDLFAADAPLTVDNFIRLARAGRLDGLTFHRVVPNFVIQDGDPRGDGNGGPPWQIRCEINLRRYGEGAVGMALSGKDTGGSQYFITHSPQPHLDGGYTVFGQVIAGQEVVDRVLQGDPIGRVVIEESGRGGR